jgi:hypothetical protein
MKKRAPYRRRGQPCDYNPTPEQIRAACEQIQAGWTPAERQKRRVGPEKPVETPIIKLEDIASQH